MNFDVFKKSKRLKMVTYNFNVALVLQQSDYNPGMSLREIKFFSLITGLTNAVFWPREKLKKILIS